MSSSPLVEVRKSEAVATLTLNAPETRNALSVAMMSALQAELDDIAAAPDVRAVILRATGPGFCAGHDLKEMQAHRNDADKGRAFFGALFTQCTRLMEAISAMPQPVIAAVQGTATAAGCQLVATCDLAVASDTAQFGVNGIDVGFFCSTPMVALSRNIGRKKTLELLTTGRMMDAGEAQAAGLVNDVVAPAALDARAAQLAAAIAAKSGAVIALGKNAFYRQLEQDRNDAYADMSAVMVENLMLNDSAEGFAAFIDKRKPRWNQD